ncbi:MAG: hypothetical protein NT083_13665 [Rhodocyclales bacterium]|nr:hypothetical protein [Rhodocyclales bacterium]
MIAGMAALVDAVQTNCDIADARHARDVSLCSQGALVDLHLGVLDGCGRQADEQGAAKRDVTQ